MSVAVSWMWAQRVLQRVKDEAIENFKEQVGKTYLEKIGYAADFYVVEVGDGPAEI